MIKYRVLKRVSVISNTDIYYLATEDFKYKRAIRFDGFGLNMVVYKDIDSLFPINKLSVLNEDLFKILSYKEVEDFFSFLQGHFNSTGNAGGLLKDFERILLYWDDE